MMNVCLCGNQIIWAVVAGAAVTLSALFIDFYFFYAKAAGKNSTQALQTSTKPPGFMQSSEFRFILAVGGIYTCYLSYGIIQEYIFKYRSEADERFTSTLFLLFVQCLVNAFFAYCGILFNGKSTEKIDYTAFFMTGTSYILAMLFSNEALKYVNYPTQALGKSCKMIPVMLFGVFFAGKKYSVREYLCVFAITAGITVFRLGGNSKATGENSTYGLVLLFLSLVMDGVTGATQDRLKKKCKPTTHESMFYVNAFALVLLFPATLFTGQFTAGFNFLYANPSLLNLVLLFSVASAAGQNFIFFTISAFSPLVCTTVTTTRKFFTILMSIVIYRHPLVMEQWLGMSLVFAGLTGELYGKYAKKMKGKGGGDKAPAGAAGGVENGSAADLKKRG